MKSEVESEVVESMAVLVVGTMVSLVVGSVANLVVESVVRYIFTNSSSPLASFMTSTPRESESAEARFQQSSFPDHTSSVDLATSASLELEELPSVTHPDAPGSMILGSTQAPGLASSESRDVDNSFSPPSSSVDLLPSSSSESERPFSTSDSVATPSSHIATLPTLSTPVFVELFNKP